MNHETILGIIQARVAEPIAIYVFGSMATGAVHESSDIDLAMYSVKTKRIGVPQEIRDASSLILDTQQNDENLANRLMKMVGFRNIAVHDYRRMNLDIVKSIFDGELDALLDFSAWTVRKANREKCSSVHCGAGVPPAIAMAHDRSSCEAQCAGEDARTTRGQRCPRS